MLILAFTNALLKSQVVPNIIVKLTWTDNERLYFIN